MSTMGNWLTDRPRGRGASFKAGSGMEPVTGDAVARYPWCVLTRLTCANRIGGSRQAARVFSVGHAM